MATYLGGGKGLDSRGNLVSMRPPGNPITNAINKSKANSGRTIGSGGGGSSPQSSLSNPTPAANELYGSQAQREAQLKAFSSGGRSAFESLKAQQIKQDQEEAKRQAEKRAREEAEKQKRDAAVKEALIKDRQGNVIGIESSYLGKSMSVEEYNKEIERLQGVMPKEKFFNPSTGKTYDSEQAVSLGRTSNKDNIRLSATPVKVYVDPNTGEPIKDLREYLTKNRIPISKEKTYISTKEDFLEEMNRIKSYDVNSLASTGTRFILDNTIYNPSSMESGQASPITAEDLSGISLMNSLGRAVQMDIDALLPPDVSISRQVERGILFGATALIPPIGASYVTNLVTSGINAPLETATGILEYGKTYPVELGTMFLLGKGKSAAEDLARAKELGISVKELKIARDYNTLSIEKFKEKYGMIGTESYAEIYKKITDNAYNLKNYNILDNAKIKGGRLSYESAIRENIKTINKEFPEISRVQAEVFNNFLELQRRLDTEVLRQGFNAKLISEELKSKNPVKYANLQEDIIVRQAEFLRANSPIFRFEDNLNMEYARGFVGEELTNRKLATNQGNFEDSFTRRRTDVTAFGKRQKIILRQFEQISFLSTEDLAFIQRGFIKDIRKFTESGKGKLDLNKGQEDYDKIAEEDFNKRLQGNVLTPEPTTFNTRGWFKQVKAWREGLTYGEGNEAVFIPFKTRGRPTIEGEIQKVRIELAKDLHGSSIEPRQYKIQLTTGEYIDIIESVQTVKDLIAPIKKKSFSRKEFERLKSRAEVPKDLEIPQGGFIELGKGRIDVTRLVKIGEEVIINEADQFGQNFPKQFGQNFQRLKQTKIGKYAKFSEFAELKEIAKYGSDDVKRFKNLIKEIYGKEVKKVVSVETISPEEMINLNEQGVIKLKEATKPTVSPGVKTQKISMSRYQYGTKEYYDTLTRQIKSNIAAVSKGMNPSVSKAPSMDFEEEISRAMNMNLSVNPEINITPQIEPTINPLVNPTIHPEVSINPLINPTINPLVNPQINPLINPLINPVINPTITPVITPTITQKPKNPKLPRIQVRQKGGAASRSLGNGYWIYVKKINSNSFTKVNNYPVTKSRAEDIGSYLVDQSVARTFQIKNANKSAQPDYEFMYVPEGYFNSARKKLRNYRLKNKNPYDLDMERYIEKQKFVGDTRAEIKQLKSFQKKVRKVFKA